MGGQPLEVQVAHLEGGYEQLDKRLGDLASSIDSRFAQIDGRFAQMDMRFGQIDLRLDGVGRRLDGFQWRVTSLIVVTWITTMLAILLKH